MEQEPSFFSAFKTWMEKPNGVENDPKTLVVILRYICLLIIPYSLSMGFMMLVFTKRSYSSVFFIGTFAGLLLFRNLLSKPVRPIFITVIIMLLLGAIVPTFMFGWDLGFSIFCTRRSCSCSLTRGSGRRRSGCSVSSRSCWSFFSRSVSTAPSRAC